jgi:hypothetical protein
LIKVYWLILFASSGGDMRSMRKKYDSAFQAKVAVETIKGESKVG